MHSGCIPNVGRPPSISHVATCSQDANAWPLAQAKIVALLLFCYPVCKQIADWCIYSCLHASLPQKDHQSVTPTGYLKEQMHLKTTPKISVFAPNCWETLTEFSCHNSTSHRKTRSMSPNNSVANTSKVTTFYSIFVLGLYLTTGLKQVSASLQSAGSRCRQPE